MFVISVRAGKKQILAALGVLLGAALLALGLSSGKASETAAGFSVNAQNAEQRLAFIRQFGWACEEEPSEICEIILPEVINETYAPYCKMQEAQGFSKLMTYAGARIKRWTYPLEHEKNAPVSHANLYIAEGKVIACDITDSTGAYHPLVRAEGAAS